MRFIVDVSKGENESPEYQFAGCLFGGISTIAGIALLCWAFWGVIKNFFSDFNAIKLIALIIFIVFLALEIWVQFFKNKQ